MTSHANDPERVERLLVAMNRVLCDLQTNQVKSRFCRMLAYSKINATIIGKLRIGKYDGVAFKRHMEGREQRMQRTELSKKSA